MLYLSKNMRVLAPTVENDWKHREELLSFDPSESLYDSTYAGEKLEAASLWLYIYCCPPYCGSWLKYIPAGVSFFPFLRIRVFQRSATKETLSKRNRRKNLQTKSVKKAHTLSLYLPHGMNNQ